MAAGLAARRQVTVVRRSRALLTSYMSRPTGAERIALWALAISTGGLATMPHLTLWGEVSAHVAAMVMGVSGILMALLASIRWGIPVRLTSRTSGILLGYPLLVILVWASLSWSNSSVYGIYKAKLYAWSLLPVLGIPLVIDGPKFLREFLMLVWLCLFVACLLALRRLFAEGGSLPFRTSMGDPITQSRAGGMLVILSWYLLMRGAWRGKLLSAAGSSVGLVVCLGTGTRGSTWALPLALLVGATWGLRRRIKRRIGGRSGGAAVSLAVSMVIAATCIWMVSRVFVEESHSLARVAPRDLAANSRVELAEASLRAWWEAPILGQGVGSFAPYWTGWDERAYPHNLILEVLAEQGVMGLFLALWMLGGAVALMSGAVASLRHEALARSVIMIVTYAFAISLISMESPNQIFLWTGLGICCSLGSVIKAGQQPQTTGTRFLRTRTTRSPRRKAPWGRRRRFPPSFRETRHATRRT